MMKRSISLILALVLTLSILLVQPSGAKAADNATAEVLVATKEMEDLLSLWATGKYSYIKLTSDDVWTMNGENLVIDLAGFDLTVSGTGNISAFDTANDTYDETACGVILNNGSVTFTESVMAPNGNHYITVMDSNKATAHRLDMKVGTVSLRTSSAGIYYKAQYDCDSTLEEKVQSYGMIVSLNNVPGADFKNDGSDINQYTVAKVPFESGRITTSGSVFGILKTTRNAEKNDRCARMAIYANAYIDLGNGAIVADVDNVGKTVDSADFSGVALSLYDVMLKIDSAYNGYNTIVRSQLDAFYLQWKDQGMDWSFTNIGQTAGTTDAVDNSNLVFDEGTTNAVCPVCQEKVTWTALTVAESHQNLNGHYYVPEDLTFENNGDAFFFNATKNSTLCVHLNGHNLTATKTRVVHGSSGRTNIMGNGIVTGYQGSANFAAAVQVNNTVANQSVHLYGGTYKMTENSNANAAAVGVSTAGGYLYIYEGATVENSGKTAIVVRESKYKPGTLGLYGCTVNGDVVLSDVVDGSGNDVVAELWDCTINGNVDVYKNNSVYLSGAPVISSVSLHDNVLNTQKLTEGAAIGIVANGIFTAESASVESYLDYFYGTEAATKITVRDNALHCGPDYTSNLVFVEGTTKAMCPVCRKEVAWTPVDGSARVDNSTDKLTQHYYLTKDVTYTAENGELSFISPGHGTHTVCVHLNGHNFTGTNARLIYGGTSTSNIMGTGVVTGSRADVNGYGSTIQINVGNITGTVNLYSGTYKQAEGGKYANDYVISISSNGGTVNVYEDATVEANSNGKAIYVGSSSLRHSISTITGTVKGDVYVEAAKAPSTYLGKVTVDGGTITGKLDVNGTNAITVGGAAKIGLLDMEETSKVTLSKMAKGAKITVLNKGVFTEPHASAADWAQYFHAANPNDIIAVVDGALSYKINYTAKIYPDAEGKAYCPACEDDVVWTALTDTSAAQNLNGHYYLTDDLVYEKTGDGYVYNGTRDTTLCLHLNGNNLTATNTYAIFGGGGYMNVMGRGVVSGYDKDVADGMTIRLNNSIATNGISLYSGTYRGYNPDAGKALISLGTNGGPVKIYEDAKVDAGADGIAIAYSQAAALRKKEIYVYGAEIIGDIIMSGVAEGKTVTSTMELHSANIIGEVSATATDTLTISGDTKISKLTLAEGAMVNFENLKDKTDITVSATGYFTPAMDQADQWLKYITCADLGDWIVVRDKAFYQEAKPEIPAASETDQAALLATYEGKTLRYGEMHNHTNSGPLRDDGTGYTPSTGADGQRSLDEWIAEMDRLKMDFAFIVDHGMSIHMYKEKFLPEYFIGGTEPGTRITDSKADPKSPHYNMLFADPEKLESIFFKWENKFKPMKWNAENYPTALNPSEEGYRIVYPSFTTAEFTQLGKDVYDAGGLFVHVHPKYDSYIYSNDPMDYYFGDKTGFEITTGSGGNMMAKDNNEAYETWVALLELGKKVWATAGSDSHKLPDYSGLTAMYTTNDHKDDYMATVREGNMAPGWIGIRMNINGTAMGGETDFTGNRLQFSVGDIYNPGVTHTYDRGDLPYAEGHTYCVQMYDDGGLLMESEIDPLEMNYFAIDCDATAKFYRVVVWDLTTGCRIGVSNPIWNTAE